MIVAGICRPNGPYVFAEWQCLNCATHFSAMSDQAAVDALNAHIIFKHHGPRPAVRGEDDSPEGLPC